MKTDRPVQVKVASHNSVNTSEVILREGMAQSLKMISIQRRGSIT